MSEAPYEGIEIENSIGAGPKSVFVIRETYDKVFPDIVSPINFNSKNSNLYGRVDKQGDIVHANEYYLKEVYSTMGQDIYCLNFVADAFEDFRDSVKIQYVNKLKKDDFLTADWDARKGWGSPHDFYGDKMSDLNQVFIKGNLLLKNNKDKIKDIDDFLEVFLNDFYPSMNGTMPLTKSGHIKSKYYNPASTGLCIEIFNGSFGLDSVKFEKFIKSPNFEFYLLAAAKHGFFVDKNAPWRLVANLNSPKMQEYMSLNNLNNQNIFDTCFIKTYKYDIQNLKQYLKQFYESLLSIYPYYMEQQPIVGTVKCPPDYQQTKKAKLRQKITQEAYDQKYSNLFWLKIYYRIKLDEIGVKQSSFLLTKELQKIEQIYNSLDFEQTLDYVNDRVKSQMNWA